MLSRDSLKFQQIDAAFRHIYDNPDKYVRFTDGDVLEFGVGSGRSLYKIVSYLKELELLNSHVYGFDSWAGLPKEANDIPMFEKFQPGAYNYSMPDEATLRGLLNFSNIYLYPGEFSQLDDMSYFDTNLNALLIHIDCDLYISTKRALNWCFKNDMVKKNTLIAFDEYQSTNELGGEQLAWYEIQQQYTFSSKEIWKNTYTDKSTGQRIRQSLWEITDVG